MCELEGPKENSFLHSLIEQRWDDSDRNMKDLTEGVHAEVERRKAATMVQHKVAEEIAEEVGLDEAEVDIELEETAGEGSVQSNGSAHKLSAEERQEKAEADKWTELARIMLEQTVPCK